MECLTRFDIEIGVKRSHNGQSAKTLREAFLSTFVINHILSMAPFLQVKLFFVDQN